MKIDKKVILANLPFLFIFWLADKLAYSYRINEGNKIMALVKGVSELFKAPVLSFHIFDLLIGVLGALAVKGVFCMCGARMRRNTAKAWSTAPRAGARRRI